MIGHTVLKPVLPVVHGPGILYVYYNGCIIAPICKVLDGFLQNVHGTREFR